jgi:hypothetical protein
MHSRSSPVAPSPALTQWLLDGTHDEGWGREIGRFGWGLGLASAYGLVLGFREGGLSLFRHALGVPLAFVAVALLGVPALLIVLTLFDAPLSPRQAVRAASGATARAGLMLAGLAPAVALYVASAESRWLAAAAGGMGLLVSGIVGLSAFLSDLGRGSATAEEGKRLVFGFCFAGFAVFAGLLAIRVWWGALPILGGGQ